MGDVTGQLPSVYVSCQQRHWWVRPSVRPSFLHHTSFPLSLLLLPRFAPLYRNGTSPPVVVVRRRHLPRSVGVFFGAGSILFCSQSGDDPQEALAKYGY